MVLPSITLKQDHTFVDKFTEKQELRYLPGVLHRVLATWPTNRPSISDKDRSLSSFPKRTGSRANSVCSSADTLGCNPVTQSMNTGSRANSVSYSVGTWGCNPVVKRPGSESEHSTPSSIEVKKKGRSYMSSTLPLFMEHSRGGVSTVMLIKLKLQCPSLAWDPSKALGGLEIGSHGHTFLKKDCKSKIF